MANPFISVLIDTYNHENFIEQAVRSVLEQDFRGDREIIVVDDGSTDKTPEILRKFESHVRILRKTNGGQASAFNLGIQQCRGEIISFLDADDWWAPNKLRRVVQAMTADPLIGFVGHSIVNVLRDGQEMIETLRDGFRFQANSMEGAALFRRRGCFLGTSRMTIRAELLRTIGPVPEEIIIQADEYLFTLAAVLAPLQILPEPLTYYRHHESNGFQLASHDLQKLTRKQQSLAALSRTLSQQLEQWGIDAQVRDAVIAYTHESAEQLRLQLHGGWPWETAQTEWRLYRLLHPEASSSHRLFKQLTLMAALFTPPRFFYGVQRALSESDLYRRARARWLPVPEMQHLNKDLRKP
jgi:GT2 family glycosyltransferase